MLPSSIQPFHSPCIAHSCRCFHSCDILGAGDTHCDGSTNAIFGSFCRNIELNFCILSTLASLLVAYTLCISCPPVCFWSAPGHISYKPSAPLEYLLPLLHLCRLPFLTASGGVQSLSVLVFLSRKPPAPLEYLLLLLHLCRLFHAERCLHSSTVNCNSGLLLHIVCSSRKHSFCRKRCTPSSV